MKINFQKRAEKFNQALTINDVRTKRIDSGIKLRKLKRSEYHSHKRSLICKGGTSASECIYNISLLSPELYNNFPHLFHSSCTFSTFLNEISSCESLPYLLPLIISLRQFLSSENRPIQETILSNVPSKLISLIQFSNFTKDCI